MRGSVRQIVSGERGVGRFSLYLLYWYKVQILTPEELGRARPACAL